MSANMAGNQKRSLVAKSHNLMPKRLSANPTPAKSSRPPLSTMLSGDRRVSRSRIAVSTNVKRSSSALGPGSGLRNSLQGQRSQSAHRTPLSGSAKRNPYGGGIENRLSTLGSATKQEANRASAVGTKNRVMQDKLYQKEVERELVDFCHANGYPNCSFSTSSFPLSSTEFKMLFVFLMRFAHPDYPELGAKFEQEVPAALKNLGYAAHVSKQMFQTLGTQHSWPSVLAGLYFMHNMAKDALVLDGSFDVLAFPNEDEAGFQINDRPSSERLFFDCCARSYVAFNCYNRDTFDDVEAEYEDGLLASMDVDVQRMKSMMDDRAVLDRKINEARQSLEEIDADVDVKKRSELKHDADKLKDLIVRFEGGIGRHEQDLASGKQRMQSKSATVVSLTDLTKELKDACRKVKVDPDNDVAIAHFGTSITNLEDQTAVKKEEMKILNESKLQMEMEVSKNVGQLENLSVSFNGILASIGVFGDGEDSFNMETHTSPTSAKRFLEILSHRLRAREREMAADCCNADRDSEAGKEELENLEGEWKRLEAALQQIRESLAQLLDEIKRESRKLTQEKEELRDELLDEHRHLRGDLGDLEKKLADTQTQRTTAAKKKEAAVVQGKELVENTLRALKLKREETLRAGDRTVAEFKRKAEEKMQEINAGTEFLKSYFEHFPDMGF